MTVIGYRGWRGANYGPLAEPTPGFGDGHPDEIDLREAEAFGREMVWQSQRIYAGDTSLIPEDPPDRRPAGGGGPPGQADMTLPEDIGETMKLMHWRLIYDKEKCLYPKCTLCMDFCPMYGIDLTMDPPVIGNPCMTCFMCDQLCPTGAILVDEAQMRWQEERHKGGKGYEERLEWRKKYPRNYVPKEEIVRGWTDVTYKTYTKHPRFVIGLGRPYGIDPRRDWNEIQED
jgi:NAD-dependent dihydropyrimidine dehydrogenase PreA subunit